MNNNQLESDSSAGISVNENCLVKDNTVIANKKNNIRIGGSDNVIEENLVTDSSYGIYFDSTGSFFANNRASGNITNYANTSGNMNGGGNISF